MAGVCAGVQMGACFISIVFEICDFWEVVELWQWWQPGVQEECKNVKTSEEAVLHPLLSAGILQDSCPTCFTKTQAYFLNTNWDRHSLHLVWRLKFIIVKTECVAPRVALLSGSKQIHLFGRCCNPIYLQGILLCYSLISIKGYLGCGQAKTLTKLTTLICCFYFESAVAFCDSC